MYLQNITFTDPQGVTHQAATFAVASATSYNNENISFSRNIPDYEQTEEDINTDGQITVQYYYWATEQARLDKRVPYILAKRHVDPNGNVTHDGMFFQFDPLAPEYDGMTLEQKCMHYLEHEILN